MHSTSLSWDYDNNMYYPPSGGPITREMLNQQQQMAYMTNNQGYPMNATWFDIDPHQPRGYGHRLVVDDSPDGQCQPQCEEKSYEKEKVSSEPKRDVRGLIAYYYQKSK